MPLHINDDDLCLATMRIDDHGHVFERPRSESTMLSYTIHALEIAFLARESIDLQPQLNLRQETKTECSKVLVDLTKKYEKFVTGLPSHFRLGSTAGLTSTGPLQAIPVHRWMLHQQLWSLFLRIHRGSPISPDSDSSCHLLAQNIISTQAQIQARCAVCGSLSTSDNQLFTAAVVLLIDLLFSSKEKVTETSNVHLRRLMTRDKIREAIELLRTSNDVDKSGNGDSYWKRGSAQRSINALEALMEIEEDDADSDGLGNGALLPESCQAGPGVSLQDRITSVLQYLQPAPELPVTTSERNRSTPFMKVADEFPTDLDVLPTLSDDPTCDLWQYLDFAPLDSDSTVEYDSLAGTAEVDRDSMLLT